MIKMKSGVYGARDGLKRASDDPFSLTDSEEARLVKRGVAEYVIEQQPKEHLDSVPTLPVYDVGMTEKQLRGIAAYYQVDVSAARKKQDIVDILDAHFSADGADDGQNGDEDTHEGEDSEVPDLGADLPTV